jgi:tetratricopeptide (TPR) repeat protein
MQQVMWDPEFEFEISRFQQNALSAHVKSETLHPFDRELFVATLRQQLLSFYTDIQRGYEILIDTVLDLATSGVSLGGMPPLENRSKRAIQHLFPSQKAMKEFSDREKVEQWADEGKPLFLALGLPPQAIAIMYDAACYLLKEGRDEDARSAFRLLLVLAPHMSDFWVGFGVAQLHLEQYEEAIESLDRATSLDPYSVQALLLLCRALVELNRRGEAEARLGARLDEAARGGNRERYEILEAARFELIKFAALPRTRKR